ncbi:MAG: Hpt domain-containing protein, partial [Bdellovibrionota bacterium]
MSANEELLPDFLAECADILEKMNSALDRLPAAPNRSELLDSVFRGIHTIKGSCGMFGFENSKSLAHELESRIAEFKAKPETLGPRDIAEIREKTSRIENLLKSRDRISNDSSVSPAPEPGAEFIRVSVARVNELLSGISEIFLIRNQMLYLFERWKGSSQEHRDFRQSWDLLDSAMRRGIGELERTAMGMRMTPVQGLFARLARAVESYQSQETGKKIRLITEGETTELDKKVLDTLGEPLIHLIRNAMDHGIETTADRAARHKSEQGVIRLSATIAGNEAVVEIEDDGKGIDPKKLVAVAAS